MVNEFHVVLVEDDSSVRASISQTLELAGLGVTACETAEVAMSHITPNFKGIVISDVQLPGMSGLQLLEHLQTSDPSLPLILITGHGDIVMAVKAMQEGAYDFIEKPFATDRLVDVVRRAIEKRALRMEVEFLRRQLSNKNGVESALLGDSALMQNVRAQILRLASTSADVLIVGETGTGKELVARCLHDHCERANSNFVAINCGGIPETLFESEIFGHEAGAFTNASKRRIGKIEYANGGTLFLDEVESMPIGYQIKLLRALQERKIERLGSNTEISVDVRIVAATKSDLKSLSEQGKFRSDLYYRLGVAFVELPPLRERREDIPMLFEHFVLKAATRYRAEVPTVSGTQIRTLMATDWPGNVRELRNVADRFVLGFDLQSERGLPASNRVLQTLAEQIDLVEKALVEQALKQYAGKPQQVSDALGIAKKTLYDKISRHGIVINSFRSIDASELPLAAKTSLR